MEANPWSQEQRQTQSSGLVCDCGGQEFDDTAGDGYYYCLECGSRAHDVVQTAVAVEDICGTGEVMGEGALYNMRRFARGGDQSQPTAAWLPSREEILEGLAAGEGGEEDMPYRFEDEEVVGPRDFGTRGTVLDAEEVVSAIRIRYVQGLQLMVQMQCEALVEKFGVSPLICGVVGGVWLRFVASTRVFDDEWASKVIENSEEEARQKAGGEEPLCRRIKGREKNEPHDMYGKRAIFIWFRALKKVIPRHSTLAVLFLACHIARQVILPTDINRWAVEAKLPYLTAFSDIDKLLGKPPNACLLRTRTLFRPYFVVGTWDLEAMAGFIAKSIGLLLPPVNFYALACRFLKELCLPLDKVIPAACRVYEWSVPVELCLSTNSLRLPTRVHVMAILIVTIRILYKIHGQGVWEMSLLNPNLSDCDEKDQEEDTQIGNGPEGDGDVEMTLESPLQGQDSEYSAIEILRILEAAYNKMGNRKYSYSNDFSSYLKYCKEVIATGVSKSYEEDMLIERFVQICEKQENSCPGERAEARQKRSREGVDDMILENNHQPVEETKESQKMSREGIHVARMGHHDKVNSWITELAKAEIFSCLEDDAINRLKLDMEENWFQYLPPMKTKRAQEYYIQYRRKRSFGKLYYVAQADYYILLRAFARLAEVDCRIMHLGALQLERRLAWTEKRIYHSLLSVRDGSLADMIDKPEPEDMIDMSRPDQDEDILL